METYRTIILPAVLYGYETWSLTLREECRLRVFENRVLRRIFEPKRDEVTGERRKLCNEELNVLYPSPNTAQVIKSRRMKWVGYVTCLGERRGVYVVCPKSKCTDFLFNYLLDLPEITSYLLRSMTLGKLHSGSNVPSTDHSSTGSHFP